MKPKFSVLIPLYNKERYLHECIDSILKQECRSAFEVIILDDGSTNNSRNIIEKYAREDSRIRLFCQENEGPLYARKKLLTYAVGEWCIFADADDYWKPELLKTLESVIERNKGCDMVCFGTMRIYEGVEEKVEIPIHEEVVFEKEDKKKLYQLSLKNPNLLAVWNKIFKKEIVSTDIYEKFREMRYGEDRIQVLQLWKAARKIVYLPKNLYCYRAMEGSLTQVIEISRFENMQKYAEALELFLEQEGIDTKENLQTVYTDLTEDFLDAIFKYNSSSALGRKKMDGLRIIRTLPYYKNLEQKVNFKTLKSYQKIRFMLMKVKAYRCLMAVDRLLYIIKKNFVKRNIYGS